MLRRPIKRYSEKEKKPGVPDIGLVLADEEMMCMSRCLVLRGVGGSGIGFLEED